MSALPRKLNGCYRTKIPPPGRKRPGGGFFPTRPLPVGREAGRKTHGSPENPSGVRQPAQLVFDNLVAVRVASQQAAVPRGGRREVRLSA
jgi:hypothetical protein